MSGGFTGRFESGLARAEMGCDLRVFEITGRTGKSNTLLYRSPSIVPAVFSNCPSCPCPGQRGCGTGSFVPVRAFYTKNPSKTVQHKIGAP